MIQISARTEFFVGDKPRPIPFKIKNNQGVVSSWDGSTVTAYYQNNQKAEGTFSCGTITNGVCTIPFPPGGPSLFEEEGTMRVDLRATDGTYDEIIARIIYKVRKRT